MVKVLLFQETHPVIGPSGIRERFEPLPEKLQSIRSMPAPRTAKEVKQFLGLIGYDRKFVPCFADISRPLTKLTRHNIMFKWTEQCQRAFNHLHELLMEYPILHYLDPKQGYVLYTDVSGIGWSGVLTQQHTDKKGRTKNHLICYVSGQFHGSQLNWAVLTKEAYAMYMSTRRLSFYITDTEVTIRSDHLPLKKFLNKQTMNSKVNNWAVELEQFKLHFKWIPGSCNLLANSLSCLLDVTPDAQQIEEPTDHEFGSYCSEELEPAEVLEVVVTEVIKLQGANSKSSEQSQKLWGSAEKRDVVLRGNQKSEQKQTHEKDSQFGEYSQDSWTLAKLRTFKMKYEEKTWKRINLRDSSESSEESWKSQGDVCIQVTEHEDVREINLPLKHKQLQELQKNDTYCRNIAKKLHKDMELQKIFIKENGILYRLWTEDG